MWARKLLISTLVASTIGGIAAPALADVDFYINVGPPPLRYEVIPRDRPGYLWVPGYWDWRRNRHVWVKGHWERQRSGFFYHAPRWIERDGRWTIERGRWDRERPRDRDHDGIRDSRDRDRDGDGVPNRQDNHPDNPRRH